MKILIAVTLAILVFLDYTITQYTVHHNIAGWVPVDRSGWITFDLEATPLQIKTDSTGDTFADSQVWFYTAEEEEAGAIKIIFTDRPRYQIMYCRKEEYFPDTLPSEVNKIWTITKLRGPRITIKCNEVTVVDILISDETCDDPENNGNVWSRDVELIEFDYYEKASDEYRPAPPGGQPGNPLTVFNITFLLYQTTFYSQTSIRQASILHFRRLQNLRDTFRIFVIDPTSLVCNLGSLVLSQV